MFRTSWRKLQTNSTKKWLTIVLLLLTVASLAGTFAYLLGAPTWSDLMADPMSLLSYTKRLTILSYANILLLLALSAIFLCYLVPMWDNNQHNKKTRKKYTRFLAISGTLGLIPVVSLLTILALTFPTASQFIFGGKFEEIVHYYQNLTNQMLKEENQKVIKKPSQKPQKLTMKYMSTLTLAQGVALKFADELYLMFERGDPSSEDLNRKLTGLTRHHSLTKAVVFNGENMEIIGRSKFAFSMDFERIPNPEKTSTPIITSIDEEKNFVRILVAIDTKKRLYLFVESPLQELTKNRMQK